MKPFLPLLALLLSCAAAHAQDSVDFKVHVLPHTQYAQVSDESYETRVDFDSSSQAVLDRLKAQGQNAGLPVIQTSHTESVLSVGGLDNSGHMPIMVVINKATGSDSSLAGLRGFGQSLDGSIDHFDSIQADVTDTAVRALLLKTMNKMFAQISNPTFRVGRGGSYTQVLPMHLPMGGTTLDLNLNMRYTLQSLEGDLAHFSLLITIGMAVTGDSVAIPFLAGGEGSGSLDYDRRQNYIHGTQTRFAFAINIHKQDLYIHIRVRVAQSNAAQASPAS